MSKENLYGIDQSFNNVYSFTVVEREGKQKIQPPKAVMPKCAKERIRFVLGYMKDWNMTFHGSLDIILAFDEKKSKAEFELNPFISGEDWLPVTEEFEKWRDEPFVNRSAEIAVAQLYGTCNEVTE